MRLGLGLGVNSITSQKVGGGVQNLFFASEAMNDTDDWSQNLISVAANSTDEAAPNSTDTAEKLTFTADSQSRIQQQVALEANTTYTFSVYAKVRTGTKAFRLRNVTLGQEQQFTADTSWGLNPDDGRYSFSFTTEETATTHTLSIQNAEAGGTGEVFFWGAMLNEGATAGGYVKTDPSFGGSAPAPAYAGFGDVFGGVSAYYSLRQFTEAETLNAIRVRRSSDDTEQDIGFDANGDLDTTALLDFVGTGGTDNGFISKWYDQSGNGNDAINADASEQPLVVSAGTLVTENSKAAIEFDGVDDKLGFTSNLNIGGSPSIIGVLNSAAGDIVWRAGGTDYWYFQLSQIFRYRNGDFDATWVNSDGLPIVTGSQKLIATYKNSTSVELAVDGTSISTKSSGTGTDGAFNHIGSDLLNIEGVWQELIIFDSDQSANRGTAIEGGGTGIEGNINTYFNIV
jgi:hypothetical protein